MDVPSIVRAGLLTSVAQFSQYASDTVRAMTPQTRAAAQSSGPLAPGGLLAADGVGQMSALASYRANARVPAAVDGMLKTTVDLIA